MIKIKSVEDALTILNKDSKGKYNHNFFKNVSDGSNKLCRICLGRLEEHPNNEVELTKEEIEIKKFKEVSKRMCKSVIDKKKLSFTKEDLNYFEAADLCQICYVNKLDINVNGVSRKIKKIAGGFSHSLCLTENG